METIFFKITSAFVMAYVLNLIFTPLIIKMSRKMHLMAQPNERSEHKVPTPSLGGVGIFASLILTIMLFINMEWANPVLRLLPLLLILFVLGVKDDLSDLSAGKKFMVQFLVAGVMISQGIRIEQLFGIFGIEQLDYFTSVVITIFAIVGITNAYNLIDGIDGLAGGIAIISFSVLAYLFYRTGMQDYLLISVIMLGGLLGFLRYNYHPAKIFMGDNGSLVIGFLLSFLVISLLKNPALGHIHANAPLILLGTILIPVFDTARVFLFRILRKKSPFKADKTHIHHLLTNAGLNHRKATWLILLADLFILVELVLLINSDKELVLTVILIVIVSITGVFTFFRTNIISAKLKDYHFKLKDYQSDNPFFKNPT